MNDYSQQLPIVHNEQMGINAVNARDLHEFMEVGRVYMAWITNRLEQLQCVEGQDYTILLSQTGKQDWGGHNRKEIYVTLDIAKHLAMLERNEKGYEARQYFINVEKKARELFDSIPKTLPEALKAYAETLEKHAAEQELRRIAEEKMAQEHIQRRALEDKVEEERPFTDYGKLVTRTEGEVLVSQFAKELKSGGIHRLPNGKSVGGQNLFEYFREQSWVMDRAQVGRRRHNQPYQRYLDQGWFAVRCTSMSAKALEEVRQENPKRYQAIIESSTTMVTGKGRVAITAYIRKALAAAKMDGKHQPMFRMSDLGL